MPDTIPLGCYMISYQVQVKTFFLVLLNHFTIQIGLGLGLGGRGVF